MRLYDILEADIIEAIESPDLKEKEGGKHIVLKKIRNRFSGFPLKVVYRKDTEVLIITAYPLKKSYRRKS